MESNKVDKSSKSLKNFRWNLLQQDEKLVKTLSQKIKSSDILSRILVNRGVSSVEEAEEFLNPKIRNLLPDPFLLQDMKKGVSRIIEAINNKQKITIFADYDVDGATSSALLHRFFKSLGVLTTIYVPCRLNEGYGPNIEAIKKIKEQGCNLLITVDCGTASSEPLKFAQELELDVVVVDHHLPPQELPEAYAIINPRRLDDEFPYKSIAAVTVAFLVAIAIRKELRSMNWFEGNSILEPDLMKLLDLVALGTVCDVMPLTGVNRPFVKYGLSLMVKRENMGLIALLDRAKVDSKPQSYHLGFVLGPRINAGGRTNQSHLGATLLTTESKNEAFQIAEKLEILNNERKEVERIALEEAIEYIESSNASKDPIVFAIGQGWHLGILGILASRIKDRYSKPCAIISINDGIGKGSARSITGIDLGDKISKAKAEGILIDGGGHAMAGGFTINQGKIEDFRKYMANSIKNLESTEDAYEKAKELDIDAAITVNGATFDLLKSIEKAAPFGNANPVPRFVIYDAKVIKATVVGGSNLMIIVTEPSSVIGKKRTLKCMLFKAMEKQMGHLLLNHIDKNIDLVGQLHSDHYWGKLNVKIVIEDVNLHE